MTAAPGAEAGKAPAPPSRGALHKSLRKLAFRLGYNFRCAKSRNMTATAAR